MRKINTRFFKAMGIAAAIVAVCVTPVIADEVSDLQDEKNKIESEVDSLEAQLTDILTDLDRMEEKAAKLVDEIEQGKKDLKVAEEKQADQYADMKLRVQYMYENRDADVADIFLSSESFSDVLNRTEYFQKIYDYDRNELEELDKTTREIQALNERLAADLEELQRQQDAALAKQAELNDLISSKRSEVSDLDERIAAVQAEIARKAAEEEAKRQAELERQRRTEEEARAAAATESYREATTDRISQEDNVSDDANEEKSNASQPSQTRNNNTQRSASSSSGSSIVNTAYNYIGVPYVYGGSSPNGFDCSGLVQYVYAQNGVSLPRTSGAQAGVGKGVSLADAKPGDIVCYPGHVAIYIGGGQVIHAPYPGRSVEVANANMMTVTTVRRVL